MKVDIQDYSLAISSLRPTGTLEIWIQKPASCRLPLCFLQFALNVWSSLPFHVLG